MAAEYRARAEAWQAGTVRASFRLVTPARRLVLASLLATLAVGPALAAPPAGGEPCALLEHLPGPKDPVRQLAPYRSAFVAMDRAGSDPKRLGRAHDALARALDRLLGEARRVFHPAGGRAVDAKSAQRFLTRHVLGRTPALRVGDEQLEPARPVQAALAWTACRGGRPEVALRWARRPLAAGEVGGLTPFAALLLLDAGRVDEARELLPALGDEGFLAAWVEAELTPDPQRRLAAHARAGRRISTPAQRDAWMAQKTRLEEQRP